MATNHLTRPRWQPSERTLRIVLLLALLAPMLVIVFGAAAYLILGPWGNPDSGAATGLSPAAAAVLSAVMLPAALSSITVTGVID